MFRLEGVSKDTEVIGWVGAVLCEFNKTGSC